jgi:beta-glucosidase
MKQDPKLLLKFPAHFLWGAASAAHQVEGGNHNQWSVWELENAKVLAEKAKYQARYLPKWEEVKKEALDPANYVSGKATDHYHRYEEDFALLKKMNMNAWRFSIEWSRIEPEEGKWDPAAIEHYRKYLQRLKQLNIEPIVTLWHWTVPVLDELGHDFRYIITLNEPEVYTAKSFLVAEWPPQKHNKWQFFWTLMHLLSAHKKVYKMAKQKGRKYLISISKNAAYHYAGDDAWLSRVTAGLMRWAQDYFMLNRIRKQLDFIGLNYYFSNRYYGYRLHNELGKQNDLAWDMQPANIEKVLQELHDRYELPIMVTENGLADRDDDHRKWWITQTLLAMHRAMQSGVKLEGYLHWSLTDNFEWSSGFWPRFGLIAIDYATKKRTLRPSAIWFGKLIGKLR